MTQPSLQNPALTTRIEALEDAGLSTREAQVIALAEHGLETRDVADELDISRATVSKYRERAREKLITATKLVAELGDTDLFERTDIPTLNEITNRDSEKLTLLGTIHDTLTETDQTLAETTNDIEELRAEINQLQQEVETVTESE